MGTALQKRLKQAYFETPVLEAVLNLAVAADFLKQKREAVCAEYGVSSTQYNILRILKGVHPNGHPRCEISGRMVENAPDVTRLLDRLESGGFVERERTKKDRRLSIAKITPEGLELVATITAKFKPIDDELAMRISEEEARMLSAICEKIYDDSSE